MGNWDAVVVGSGPNGLSAAITLAREGRSVRVLEAGTTLGGGARSAEVTLAGFVHDICSAVHPLGVGSPFFRSLSLEAHGLSWVHPPAPLAHPFDDGTAALLERTIAATGETIPPDAARYRKLMEPFAEGCDRLLEDILAPAHVPRHPLLLGRFGTLAIRSGRGLAEHCFEGMRARALFAGVAAHAILPLETPLSASFGLVLGMLAHAFGWPVAAGGSQRISDALAGTLRSLGGEIETGSRVDSLERLPPSRAIVLDVSPHQLLAIAGKRLPERYRRRLGRYRHGPGAFKMDWALDGPIPWKASACARSATVHLGGTIEEIAAAESAVASGREPERPFVLLAQPSLFDPTRAPAGKHTAWGYCHVPNGSTADMTARIEAQIERFAPGFGERVLARRAMPPAALEAYNANYVGGDIAGGALGPGRILSGIVRPTPYATPAPGVFLCSASTPPGAGVHGMCGHHAARAVLEMLERTR